MASETLPHRLESLAGFTVESVLNDGKESGVVALLGTFPGCATGAVVKLSRPSIPLGDPNGLAGAVTLVERQNQADPYNLTCFSQSQSNNGHRRYPSPPSMRLLHGQS